MRVWAAAALARVDPAHPGAIPALVAALHDEAGFVSLGAWHLGRIGPGAAGIAEAIPVLTALRDDPNRSTATEAALALKGLQHPGVRRAD